MSDDGIRIFAFAWLVGLVASVAVLHRPDKAAWGFVFAGCAGVLGRVVTDWYIARRRK